jgi:hypothetical protein
MSAYSAETPGYSARKHRTSVVETCKTSCFHADKPSARMETQFICITARPIP